MHIIDRTNELAHSISCIEQVNKYYVQCVSDNGLHPVTWLSCPSGKAITYFLTYIGLTNKCVPSKCCHLGWYRYFVWPMDYMGNTTHDSVTTRGQAFNLKTRSFRLDVARNHFCNRVVLLWNSLPAHVVNKQSSILFKADLRNIYFTRAVKFTRNL